jgi:hypothetical protein
MGALINHIRTEWHVMKGAPFSFVVLLLLGLSVGFYAGMQWRAQEVANAESLVRVKEAERQFSEQQLSNISPSTVDIGGGRPDKPDPRVDQLKTAFKESGWNVATGGKSTTDAVNLVLRTQDMKASTTIENALKDAGVTYQMAKPSTAGGTDFLLGPAK